MAGLGEKTEQKDSFNFLKIGEPNRDGQILGTRAHAGGQFKGTVTKFPTSLIAEKRVANGTVN